MAGEAGNGAEHMVRFEGVQKSYDGEILVVKDLNLDIEKGEFMTMLGPSGSGKTTCLMMLAGFEPATHGEIYLNNQPINNVAPHKRGIGMVFQNYALFPHMTVAENLAFPLQVRRMSSAETEERVNRALSMVELPEFGFEFFYRQVIPIVGPLVGTFSGKIGGTLDLGFGYDTLGLQQFLATDNPAFLLNGFFINDIDPATGVDREAYVPKPYGVLSVSPSTTLMSVAGMPSSCATIWANVVSWPWPWDFTPSLRMALPVGCTRSSAESNIFKPAMS